MYVQFTSCVHWDDCVWSFLISLVTINNIFTANIYLFRVKNRNTRKRCKMCSKLTIKTPVPEWCHWCRSGFLIVNFEHISLLFLCFCCWLWTSKCYLEKNFLATIYKICRCIYNPVKHLWWSSSYSLWYVYIFNFNTFNTVNTNSILKNSNWN